MSAPDQPDVLYPRDEFPPIVLDNDIRKLFVEHAQIATEELGGFNIMAQKLREFQKIKVAPKIQRLITQLEETNAEFSLSPVRAANFAALAQNPATVDFGEGYNVPALALPLYVRNQIIDETIIPTDITAQPFAPLDNLLVLKRLEKFGRSSPKHQFGNRTLSNAEIFDERIAPRGAYYPKEGDEGSIKDPRNKQGLINTFDGVEVMEICSGTCRKSELIIRTLREYGVSTTGWHLNDIVWDSLDSGRELVLKAGGYTDDQVQMVNANILTQEFAEHRIWERLKNSRSRVAIVWLGATEGNFTDPELGLLYSILSKNMRHKDILVASLDNTLDRPTVELAYNDPGDRECFQHFFMGLFIHTIRSMGLKGLKYDELDCVLEVDEKKKEGITSEIAIEVNIIIGKEQVLTGLGLPVTLPKGRIRAGLIRKKSESTSYEQAYKHKLQRANRLKFWDAQRPKTNMGLTVFEKNDFLR